MGNKSFFFIVTILISLSFFYSCEKDEGSDSETEPPTEESEYALGWIGEDDIKQFLRQQISDLEVTIFFGGWFKFPQLVTKENMVRVCLGLAYNLKTALNGMSKGLSSSQLAVVRISLA